MKIHQVQKARKSPGSCCVCHRPIEIGAAYKWVQEYRGVKRSAHADCKFRSSHLATGRLSEVYAAQESAQDELADVERGDAEALRNCLETLRDEVQRLADEYQESADSIGEHFEGSEQHQELEDHASELEDWYSNLDDAVSELDEFDDEDPDREDPENETDEEREERRLVWFDERLERAETLLGECPL